jgi:hypothetical protein
MDLIAIAKTLWRYKLVTLPIIILTFIGAVYLVALKTPVYQADSSYILVNPPNPPTPAQLERDPALGRLNSNNPLVGYANLNIIVDLLAERMSTAERSLLVAKGADPGYTIAPNVTYLSAPIIDIVGTGPTPAGATTTAKLVGQQMLTTLNAMQTQQGTSRQYWITAQQLQVPDHAQTQLSSKLRSLIGVLAAGMILLFIAVSIMKGAAERRLFTGAEVPLPDVDPSASDWVRDMDQMYREDPVRPAYSDQSVLDDDPSVEEPNTSVGSFGHDLRAQRPVHEAAKR